MDILVVSDTHGRRDRLLAVLRRAKADVLLFLGDGLSDLFALPEGVVCRAVRGNCDFYGADTPESRIENFGAYRVFMTHGHRYGVKYSTEAAIVAALEAGADVLLYGHTHLPETRSYAAGSELLGRVLEKPFTILCPGSLGLPPDGVPSFGTLTIKPNGVLAALGTLT